jgi:tRNA uridine 5-carboxymethylaminomethyl modification enzyme
LVDDARWAAFNTKVAAIDELAQFARDTAWDGRRLIEQLRRPDADVAMLEAALAQRCSGSYPAEVLTQVLIDARYAGYLARQERQVEKFRRLESTKIPPYADYTHMTALRAEARQKFAAVTPVTLGQAARIAGISPADIMTLAVYLASGKP